MAVFVKTSNPSGLLKEIKERIDKGKIDTWSYDSEGDFTHTPDQWRENAWFRPVIEEDRLVFGILGNKGVSMTKSLYAIYHGRFIEMLLTHFDNDITLMWPSVDKTKYDIFK